LGGPLSFLFVLSPANSVQRNARKGLSLFPGTAAGGRCAHTAHNPLICCVIPASPTQVCRADTALEKESLALSRSPPPSALPRASRLEVTLPEELWEASVLLRSAMAFFRSPIQLSLRQGHTQDFASRVQPSPLARCLYRPVLIRVASTCCNKNGSEKEQKAVHTIPFPVSLCGLKTI